MDINTISGVAQDAANIENSFNQIFGYDIVRGDSEKKENQTNKINVNGTSYEVLDMYEYSNPDYPDYPDYFKGAILKSESGEVIFHFNGTGDGNWNYNAASYGAEPQPSRMQEECAKWFDEAYERLTQPDENGVIAISSTDTIYVTGHSQGGNNAMYVTMRAKNADKIDLCVPLDGPGFSDRFVSDTKEILGEDYYKQTGKIWAFNGEHDFVSILGQNSIIPEGHTKYIKYSKEVVDIMCFHTADGLVDENGNFLEILGDDSPIRKRLASAVEKIIELPQEDQALAAKVIMAFCENTIGDPEKEPRKDALTSEDFDRIKPYLIPVLIELLAYNPEEIAENIQFLLNTDYDTAQAIANLIIKVDSYPVETRESILNGAVDLLKYKDGKIEIDTSGIPGVVVEAFPILLETLITNPNDVWSIVQELGLGDWIKEKPWETAGVFAIVAIASPIWSPVATVVVKGGLIIDLGIRIVQGIVDIAIVIKDAILDFFDSVKNTIDIIIEWFHNTFNNGARYVKEHPYFKADTDRLYHYAARLQRVNSRLSSLDSDLRSLYWQVGFLDLWDILLANMLTCESDSLNKAKNYLMDTADRLSIADGKAKGYLEG